MKLFQGLLGKSGGIAVAAPVSGRLIPIREVNDPTFGEEVLGKGVAIIPSDNRICAPIDGTVTTVFPTGHAAAITGHDGTEVLIHVGLDTVKLKGQHFSIHAENGQQVSRGDLLIEADMEAIRGEGYDIITPVVICNSEDYSEFRIESPGDVAQGDVVMTLKK